MTPPKKFILKDIGVLVILFTIVHLPSCASKESSEISEGKVYIIDVESKPNANLGSPIAVDIVSLYDDQFVNTLESIPASGWFIKKNEYKDKLKDKIYIFAREFIPGEQVQVEYTTEIEKDPITNFIFANYNTPGEHRVRVDEFKTLRIILEEAEFSVGNK